MEENPMETQPIDVTPERDPGVEAWNIVAEADIVPFHAAVVSSEPDPVAQRLLQFEGAGMALAEKIAKLAITDQASYTAGGELLKEGNFFLKESSEFVEPIRLITYGLYQKVMETKKRIQSAVDGKLPVLKMGLLAFERKQEDLRRQLEREANEKQRREEEEQRRQSAEAARAVGMDEASVETILTAPSTTPAAAVAPTFQRVAGVSSRENWCAEITDLWALVKAVAKDKKLLP